MSLVLVLSLMFVLLAGLAFAGLEREQGAWKVAAVASGLAVALQAFSGLEVMAEPYRLQYWQLNWCAVAGAVFICGRGLLWKLWI